MITTSNMSQKKATYKERSRTVATQSRAKLGPDDAERFWQKVYRGFSCWEWQGATKGKGYGAFWIKSKPFRAHRIAWELTRGPIAPGMLVLHTCDNVLCVNPDHLFLGTNSQNMLDMHRRGRGPVVRRDAEIRHLREALGELILVFSSQSANFGSDLDRARAALARVRP